MSFKNIDPSKYSLEELNRRINDLGDTLETSMFSGWTKEEVEDMKNLLSRYKEQRVKLDPSYADVGKKSIPDTDFSNVINDIIKSDPGLSAEYSKGLKKSVKTEDDMFPVYSVRLKALEEVNPEYAKENRDVIIRTSLAAQELTEFYISELPGFNDIPSKKDISEYIKNIDANKRKEEIKNISLKYELDTCFDDNKPFTTLAKATVKDMYVGNITTNGKIASEFIKDSNIMTTPLVDEKEGLPNQASGMMNMARTIANTFKSGLLGDSEARQAVLERQAIVASQIKKNR